MMARPVELVQYWKNDIKGHMGCVEHPCSFTAYPIVGNFDGSEPYSLIRWIAERQDTGLHFDNYHCNNLPDSLLTDLEKRNVINDKRNQRPESRVGNVYRGVPVLTFEAGSQKLFTKTATDEVFSESIFMPVTTPNQFNYSVSASKRLKSI